MRVSILLPSLCTYVRTYVCMYVCIYVYLYVCMYVCGCMHYVSIYVCMYVYVCIMYVYVCIYVYIHIQHIKLNTRLNTCTPEARDQLNCVLMPHKCNVRSTCAVFTVLISNGI